MLLKQGEGKERDEEWLTVRPGMSLENSQKCEVILQATTLKT